MNFETNKEKLIFYHLPVIIFSLIPFFLITGPFLSDLGISLISILFLIYCCIRNNFSFFKNKFFYFFLFFWVYLVINSLINNFNIDSLKISFFYFRYGIFVIAIVSLTSFSDKFVKYFFYCIFFCFTILIVDGFYQYFIGKNIFGWTASVRITSFFGDEKILGSYLSRLWPIFFGLSIFYLKKKNFFYILLIVIFILSEVLIFLSGDRTAFFYINLSAIFIILFSNNIKKLRLFTLLISILVIIIISFVNPTAKKRVFDRTLAEMNLTEQNNPNKHKEFYIFTKTHNQLYITAYEIFLDNKILGVGIKNFRNFCDNDRYKKELSCSTHPHNTYLQLLSETGIIGFLFLIIVLFYFCKNILKHFIARFEKRYIFSDFQICILSGVAIYLWPIAPTGNIFGNWLNIIMILNLPFLIWSQKF